MRDREQDCRPVHNQKHYDNLVITENRLHKGDWITRPIAEWYVRKAAPIIETYGTEYVGELRILGKELQGKYGVTELEARNILCGVHISDYVDKYHRIKYCIPIKVNSSDRELDACKEEAM